MIVRKLVLSNFRFHRVRLALTSAAIVLAVSLVVAVTSGYSSGEAAITSYLSQYMGGSDVTITPDTYYGTISESVVNQLRGDARVLRVAGRLESQRGLLDNKGFNISGHVADMIAVRRDEDHDLDRLTLEAGRWWTAADGDAAVIDQVVAELCKAKVGSTILLPVMPKPVPLKVTGIVRKPQIMAEVKQTIYLPLATLQRIDSMPGRLTRIMVDLKAGVDAADFATEWESRLREKNHEGVRARSAREIHRQMEKDLDSFRVVSYLGGTVSMLAATFIIFSTLSMGVLERSRSLAMLRAIGASRAQLAGVVVLEGIVLAAIGVIIGSPLGWLWMKILATWKSDYFTQGVVISWGGLIFAAAGSIIAALLASLLPAWNATSVSPLEAMTPQAPTPSRRPPWISAAIGLALLCADPIIIYLPNFAPTPKLNLHLAAGLPAMMLGFFLLSPLCVWLVEHFLAGLLARAMRLQPVLLRQQLSSGLWRAAGTCASLMVGLAVLVVMHVQGNSLLKGWRIPNKFPDIFIWAPGGLTDEQVKSLADLKEIKDHAIIPVAYEAVPVEMDPTKTVKDLWPSSTIFFGVEPSEAVRAMELEFRDNDGRSLPAGRESAMRDAALARLKQGRAIIITDEFRQLYGLKIGDVMRFRTPRNGVVDYHIAGIIWSPGMEVMVSVFDMERQFDQRTAASVFGTLEDMRRDFGIERYYMLGAYLETGVNKDDLLNRMQTDMDHVVSTTRPATSPAGQFKNLREMAMAGLRQVIGQLGLKAGDVRKIKEGITVGMERVLLLLSTVAMAALAVASLGVTNTVMASIRSRRWQFGILRSIGAERSDLLRLVLAESLLLGAIGSLMGLGAGFLMAFDANGLDKYMMGIVIPMVPPWGIISIGVAAVMAVSIIASLLPAMQVSRTEPLELLQAGRATG